MLRGPRAEPICPLHWPLEFPEVTRRGGFDAVVSNPPFIGGQKLTGRIGEDLREYLIKWIAQDKRGSADLCSYFLLRYLNLAPGGRTGIIATNTIAQGDTREVGLDQSADRNWDIYRAVKSQPWSGTASLEVSLVWEGHASETEERVLDNHVVPGITASLDPVSRVTGKPNQLAANANQAFQGSIPLGKGFMLAPDRARKLIEEDPRNKDVLFPYLIGDDVNQRWDHSASRWVINFHGWPEERAATYVEAYRIVQREVKPFRAKSNRKARREAWWRFAERAKRLYEAIAGFDRVLVIAQNSRTQIPTLVPNRQVFDQKLVVFTAATATELSFRTSVFQFWWTVRKSGTIKADLVYAPSDCCETLSKPTATQEMNNCGDGLDRFRREVMKRRRINLTALYDLLANSTEQDEDIARLREIHVEIDEAVREAYALDEEREPEIREFEARIASAPLPSWREIELGHGFHETRQGVRFTISPEAQLDVLDKLLALNHYRYRQEQEKGLTRKKRRRASAKPAQRAGEETSLSIEDMLSPGDDTLF